MTAGDPEKASRPLNLVRIFLIVLSLPACVGAFYIGLVVFLHTSRLEASWMGGGDPPMVLAMLLIALMYFGIFSWFSAPLTSGAAVLVLLVHVWRKRSLSQIGLFAPILVLGSGLAWIVSVPFFMEALKW